MTEAVQPLVKQSSTMKRSLHRKVKRSVVRSRRRIVRYGFVLANIAVLIAVGAFVLMHRTPENTTVSSLVTSGPNEEISDPLDMISSADIAVNIAMLTRLDEVTSVVNNADTVNAQLEIAPSDTQIISKPQIVETAIQSKDDIVSYVTQEGDTIPSLAERYGVTADSIRWSNDLSRDTLPSGLDIVIPPIEGIVYKVKSGDTAASLASRFRSDENRIVAFNDAELAGLTEGEYIVIPDGRIVNRPLYSSYYAGVPGTYSARYGGNGYVYGWCTWHAANRRIQNGQVMPSNLGNAISWYSLAQRAGLPVGNDPRAGAIVWHANLGGLGHVAYVENVNPDGSILVSDMNYPIWGQVTYRTVVPSEFGNYRFIY